MKRASSDDPEFVSVGTFESAMKAEIAKAALDAFSIECYLVDGDRHVYTGFGYEWRGTAPWLRLVVRPEDADRAREVLAENEGPRAA